MRLLPFPVSPSPVFAALCLAAAPGVATADPTIFQGNASAESAWRAAAGGNVPLENFESYVAVSSPCGSVSDGVSSLPALGVILYGVGAGHLPGVYTNAGQAHSGANQLANFGHDVPCVSFVDYFIEAAPGKAIVAAGLWQCDPQGNLLITAENGQGQAMFGFTALINNGSGNSFGGFVSAQPVARLRVQGEEGDGWNHLDDLQILTVDIGAACNLADITEIGGTAEAPGAPDGQLTLDDILVFINLFGDSTGCPNGGGSACSVADVTGVGGPPEAPDGQLTLDDILAFINAFGEGC